MRTSPIWQSCDDTRDGAPSLRVTHSRSDLDEAGQVLGDEGANSAGRVDELRHVVNGDRDLALGLSKDLT